MQAGLSTFQLDGPTIDPRPSVLCGDKRGRPMFRIFEAYLLDNKPLFQTINDLTTESLTIMPTFNQTQHHFFFPTQTEPISWTFECVLNTTNPA
jgi:hypothetical protein